MGSLIEIVKRGICCYALRSERIPHEDLECYIFRSANLMSKFPMPGTPVRGSKSGKPLMAVFDLLGRSWSIGILWQLSEGGSATFRELQARCETVSPTVLNARLKELRQAGLVERAEDGYCATSLGIELYEMLAPLRDWSRKWARKIKRDA